MDFTYRMFYAKKNLPWMWIQASNVNIVGYV